MAKLTQVCHIPTNWKYYPDHPLTSSSETRATLCRPVEHKRGELSWECQMSAHSTVALHGVLPWCNTAICGDSKTSSQCWVSVASGCTLACLLVCPLFSLYVQTKTDNFFFFCRQKPRKEKSFSGTYQRVLQSPCWQQHHHLHRNTQKTTCVLLGVQEQCIYKQRIDFQVEIINSWLIQ